MKITIIFVALIALVLMLVAAPLAMAEDIAVVTDNSTTAQTTSSETPNLISTNTAIDTSTQTVDSQTTAEINDDLTEDISGLQVGMARVGLWFTFNEEKKAQKELQIAKLELIRARMAARDGDNKGFDNALAAHDALIERVRARVAAIDGESTKEGVKGSAVKLVGLERAIEVHEARIQKLNDLLASSNFSEDEIAKIQARLDKAQANTDHLKEVEAEQKEKLKTKLMAVGGMTEEEANAEIQNIEENQSLDGVKKLIAEKKIENAEKYLEKLKEKIAEAKAKGKDTTKAEERISAIEQKLTEAKTLVESGDYSLILGKLKQAENDKRESAKEIRGQIKENIKDARNEIREKNQERIAQKIKAGKSATSSDDSTNSETLESVTSDETSDDSESTESSDIISLRNQQQTQARN